MSNALEIRQLTKHFTDFTLDHVDISLPRGAIMGLIGSNGAGKSTTIKLMLGLMQADEGSVEILGCDDFGRNRALREHVGVVMDESSFPDNLTLSNIGQVMKNCYHTWDGAKFQSFAVRFGLPAGKPVKEFSRGMKMKLSIAVALSHDSHLLILDEATSGLDPIVRDEMLDVFLEFIQDENHAILISSHIISDLEKICDYICCIHQGRILLTAPKDELLESYVVAKGTAEEVQSIAGRVGLRKNAFGAETLALREKVPQGIAVDPATLEEIMLFYVKGEC